MSSIDDVWAEMKASALPKSQPSTTSAPKVSSGKPVIRLKSRDPDNANVANVPRGAADVLESIQREINGISDDRVETRRTSFRALMDALIVTDPIEGQPASNVIAGLAAVLKSALKRFSDPVETCREMAIRLVLEYNIIFSPFVSLCIKLNEFASQTHAFDVGTRVVVALPASSARVSRCSRTR
jgi:hypothetical protein